MLPPPRRRACERRGHHRLGRPDRLGGRGALRRGRPRGRRHRQRHAQRLLRARRRRRAWNADAARGRARLRATRHHDVDIRDRDGDRCALPAATAAAIELVDPHAPRSRRTTGRRGSRSPTSTSTPAARSTCSRRRACTRRTAPFIFTSTNKVYGDTPNRLPLVELETRWEIDPSHTYDDGIREDMSIDATLHSLFGASKVAADVLVQEYGRYFGLPTACFRGGTLTGPHHSAAELHGFLAYVMRCAMSGTAVHGVRLQGQAGPRRHPQPRPGRGVRRVLPGAAGRPRSTTSAAGGSATARCSRRSSSCEEIAGRGARVDVRGGEPDRRPHLVDRRQRAGSSRTTRTGGSSTTSGASSRRCHEANVDRWTACDAGASVG